MVPQSQYPTLKAEDHSPPSLNLPELQRFNLHCLSVTKSSIQEFPSWLSS